ncbi:hypothetical protein V2J09_001764 [Rumex salicifolius]
MSDNLMDKVTSLGERLKMTEVGRKMSAGMSSVSFRMKELFQGPNQTDKIVEDATSEALEQPDWSSNLEICDMINQETVNSVELIRGIKKRIMLKNPRIQYLALALLETIVKNCEKAFSEVAAERVLDEMVKLIDDPETVVNNRNKALIMIESWGESSEELRYLPVYEETYKSLRSRGIRFPGRDNESLVPIFTPPRTISESETSVGLVENDIPVQTLSSEQTKEAFDVARNCIELLTTVLTSSPQHDVLEDDLTTALVQQCRSSQSTIMRIIDTVDDNEAVLFEALNVNDEIQKILTKYDDLKKPMMTQQEPEPAMIPIAVEPEESPRAGNEDSLVRKTSGSQGFTLGGAGKDDMLDDLDEMIFGNKAASGSDGKKQPPGKDDLISF